MISIWDYQYGYPYPSSGADARQALLRSRMPMRKRSRRALGSWSGASHSTIVSPGEGISRRLTNVGQHTRMPVAEKAMDRQTAMKQLNLAEAKAKLSHLVDQAARGKGFIIAKSGKPKARRAKKAKSEETKPKASKAKKPKAGGTREAAE